MQSVYPRRPLNHPCFNRGAAHTTGRVHLPIALHCNIQCNYCNRLFDCFHECRPGVTSAPLAAEEVLPYLRYAFANDPTLSVVGLAGPGDPFAEPEKTLAIIEMVHRAFPQVLICVSSNGLQVPEYAGRIAKSGVTHATITVNALNADVGARIYRWAWINGRQYSGRQAAEQVIARQLDAIQRLKNEGIIVKANTVIIPEVNEGEVDPLAKEFARLRVDLMNIIPLLPVAGTPFEALPSLSQEVLIRLRHQASVYVPQMSHCARCRADAAGLLGKDQSQSFNGWLKCRQKTASSAPYARAAATTEGA
ncbi:MAG TPA: radical SAM protein [Thermodesulfobacteriota bacterium]|nr:radical SAM protein [Thermodesulfobacteriota bacterium]